MENENQKQPQERGAAQQNESNNNNRDMDSDCKVGKEKRGMSVEMEDEREGEKGDDDDTPDLLGAKLYVNPRGGKTGLVNIGNTCFLNASLQALMHCPPVVGMLLTNMSDLKRFRKARMSQRMERKFHLVQEFMLLLRKLWSGRYLACSPKELYRDAVTLNPAFRGYGHHDAHEFIYCVLDCIHEALMIKCEYDFDEAREEKKRRGGEGEGREKKEPSSDQDGEAKEKKPENARPTEFSIVSDLFKGKMRSDVTCPNCASVSIKGDTFLDLSLEIPQDPKLKKVQEERGDKAMTNVQQGFFYSLTNMIGLTSPPLSLETLLHSFCTSSDLDDHNLYRCEKCNQRVDANTVLSITTLPEVMWITIKRFSYHHYGSKVGRHVIFPLKDLDMKPYLHESLQGSSLETKYDLFGVVRHSGGLSGGHYVAYARSHVTGHWYSFDDRHATQVTSEHVQNQQAYILMYVRKPNVERRKEATGGVMGDDSPAEAAAAAAVDGDEAASSEGAAATNCPQESCYLVSKYWRRKCQYMSNPGPIDNRILCCGHGVPLPSSERFSLSFPVSQRRWATLQKTHGGGPPIRADSKAMCPKCESQRIRTREKRSIILLERQCKTNGCAKCWYLVDEVWMKEWRDFIYGAEHRPGPITNSNLFDEHDKIRSGLEPAKDYRGLREPVWRELQHIYGGGPPIIREKISIYGPAVSPGKSAEKSDRRPKPMELTNSNKD
mmetsp:Transcript_23415/g.37690  ORF Transcript_23415/g.37690 Transcript_23415/m.37690 type:complete len:720 (+) Transcript_23415:141-2300(+)